MFKRDRMLFGIEKIGQVLAKIIGLKQQGELQKAHELSEQCVSEEFLLSESYLDTVSPEEFGAWLVTQNYPAEKLDLLAQLLFERAHPFEDVQPVINRLHLVLVIFKVLEEDHHIQSLTNLSKRDMIDKFLNNQQYE